MNNKTIIEFVFRIILEGVIRQGPNTLADLLNSSDDSQPHSIINNYYLSRRVLPAKAPTPSEISIILQMIVSLIQ